MQQQHGFLQQAFRRFRIPDHALAARGADVCFGLRAGPLRTADHHRRRMGLSLGLDLFHQLRGRNVGYAARSSDDAVQVLLPHHRQRLSAGAHGDDLDVASAQDFPPAGRGAASSGATISSFLVRRSRE